MSHHSTNTASKKYIVLILVLIVLAVPLVWMHLEKFEETRALKDDNERLSASLQLCEEAAEVEEIELFYELNGLDVTAETKEVTFADLFTAESLEAQATGACAKTVDEAYFDTLASAFEGVKGTEYSFKANGAETEVYTVTLFPNASGYETFEGFENDFEICAVGGEAYPLRMNENVLMFGSSCSAGYGEEIPVTTCADIKEALTVEFN